MDVERLDTHGKSVRPSLVGHGVAEFSHSPIQNELLISIDNYRVFLTDTEVSRLAYYLEDRKKGATRRV